MEDLGASAPATKMPPITGVTSVTDVEGAIIQEHELTLLQSLKLYPKAAFWSLVLSTAVIMEGYDTKLLTTLFAQPEFVRSYGKHIKGSTYSISAPWQLGLANGGSVGGLLGLVTAGYLTERIGFRKTLMMGLVLTIGLIFIQFFAGNLTVLLVGQILFGFPMGMFQVITVVYALEIAPVSLRAYLTHYVQFCWAFGQIIATGILRGLLYRADHWAYRIPFAVQWVWPVILIPLIYLAPESPWWLVRKGRVEEARGVVQRLTSPGNVNFDVDKAVALMVATTRHERELESEASYLALFKGLNLKRTLICIGIYCIQVLSGNSLRGYSTYFLEQAGLPTKEAFNMTIAGFAVAIGGGFFSWVLLPLFSRRATYNWNLVLMFVIMILVGALGAAHADSPKASYSWAIGSMLIISSFIYNCSIGPLTNTLCVEISSATLRSKSIATARFIYAILATCAGVITPYQLNPTAWNWGAKTGFFWAGGCLIAVVFGFFCVPEPKGRTTAEMDILFERNVPLRHFARTHIDVTEISDRIGDEKKVSDN